jgi:hypothetical protein
MSGQVFNIFQGNEVQRNMKCTIITDNWSNDNEVQYHSQQNDRIQRHTLSDNHGQFEDIIGHMRFKWSTSGPVPVAIQK